MRGAFFRKLSRRSALGGLCNLNASQRGSLLAQGLCPVLLWSCVLNHPEECDLGVTGDVNILGTVSRWYPVFRRIYRGTRLYLKRCENGHHLPLFSRCSFHVRGRENLRIAQYRRNLWSRMLAGFAEGIASNPLVMSISKGFPATRGIAKQVLH